MDSIIQVRDLTFKYGKKVLFNKLSLDINEGMFVSIIGSNNCGKTTLIKLLGGILPNNKTIVAGYSYVNSNRIQASASFYGIVIHDFSNKFLFEKVYDELVFPLENLCYEKKMIEDRVIEVAKIFKITKLLDRNIKDITSSEKQKLLLALSYVHKPKVLLLDNPFIMMTKSDKKDMLNSLREINKQNKVTIVLASNDLEEIIDLDYTYVFDEGKLIMEGKPLSVLREEMILNKIGLKLPFMADLSFKLEFYELIKSPVLELERMVDTLWK
ncbi:MAG: ABC transporter ATP-binding protein [Bacilli bacterium]|nr:ABC transporter ATP-binding protein [Bacilli bacterium]